MRNTLTLSCLVLSLGAQAQWATNGTNINSTNTGNVGIGTATPAAKLDVAGNLNLSAGSQYNIGGVRMLSANGTQNMFLGSGSGNAVTTGQRNALFGFQSGPALTTGSNNAFIGYRSGFVNNTGGNNIFIGSQTGYSNTTGSFNGFFGTNAGYSNTTADYGLMLGYFAGYSNTTGAHNAFIGYQAGYTNQTGNYNVALGSRAGYMGTGSYNAYIGYQAGRETTTGENNAYFGNRAGYLSTTGGSNTFIGSFAGDNNTTGSQNTYVGSNAKGTAALTNATAIGANASVTASNSVVIGNATTNMGVGVSAPTQKLHVAGSARITGAILDSNNDPGTPGQVLSSTGTWIDWISPAAPGGSLDQAYDFGGPGLGRTIIADTGAVKITGTDGFLVTGTFGSGDTIEIQGAGTRMFFNPQRGAFRAGTVEGAEWDPNNLGEQSFASGYANTASGSRATAMGQATTASGSASTAMGSGSTASGTVSTAMGGSTIASEYATTAMGESTIASGGVSTAMGYHTTASGDISTSMGQGTTASGQVSTGMGHYTIASGYASTTMGSATEAYGNYSTAMGRYSYASGEASVAMGNSASASGSASTAMGNAAVAAGDFSTAVGSGTHANGIASLASGAATNASGHYSTAMGFGNYANSYGETVLGLFNSPNGGYNQYGYTGTDRLFVIGNGTDDLNRSDALRMLKNGYTALGNIDPTTTLDVDGQIRIRGGSPGAGKVLTSDADGFASWELPSGGSGVGTLTLDNAYDAGSSGAGRTINADAGEVKIEGTDGFLVTGSFGTGADVNASGLGTRMFFNPKLSAFRAGQVSGDQWDLANIGDRSFASGASTKASGSYSTAMGYESTASGFGSTALGLYNTASGFGSMATGRYTVASYDESVAMGDITTASGAASFAMGQNIYAKSFAEFAVGTLNTIYTPTSTTGWSATDRLFVIGNGQSAQRSDAMVVLKNGNTGLGTSFPNYRLEVSGTFSSSKIVDNGTNVGIGNSSPTANLHVGTTTGASVIIGNTEALSDAGTSILNVAASFRPSTDNARTLGGSVNRWTTIYATNGTINTSDLRDKRNVTGLRYGLKEIMSLRPVTYQWNSGHDQNTKIGLIAQDLQKVLPEVVADKEFVETDEKTGAGEWRPAERLGVFYSDIIPVLIKGMQEQQERIEAISPTGMVSREEFEALQAKNDRLEKLVEQLIANQSQFEGDLQQCCFEHSGSATGMVGNSGTDAAKLEQNQPNPFHENTTIKYYLPNATRTASIVISDLNGVQLKSFDLSGSRGAGQVLIGGGAFAAGTYVYTLTVNGKQVDSKRMVLM